MQHPIEIINGRIYVNGSPTCHQCGRPYNGHEFALGIYPVHQYLPA